MKIPPLELTILERVQIISALLEVSATDRKVATKLGGSKTLNHHADVLTALADRIEGTINR